MAPDVVELPTSVTEEGVRALLTLDPGKLHGRLTWSEREHAWLRDGRAL